MNELLLNSMDVVANMDIETVLTEGVGFNKDEGISIPLTELSSLGAGFSSLSKSFRTITTSNASNGEQLYRAVFPEGISGAIVKFKDSDALTGMIRNEEGLVGTVRWTAVDGAKETMTTVMPMNPAMIFMGAALISINHKLDTIKDLQEEIIDFLQRDKESKIIGSVNTLFDTIKQYRYNWNNEKFLSAKLNLVQTIKKEAKENEIFYRKGIEKSKSSMKGIHTTVDARKYSKKIRKDFQYYKLSVYMYVFSEYIETMLLGNFSSEYLSSVIDEINEYDLRYRKLFTKCSSMIEHAMRSSVDAKLFNGVADANRAVGKAIEKVPVLEKGPVDELMIGFGKWIKDSNRKSVNKEVRGFYDSRTCDASQFVNSLITLKETYNSPNVLYFDDENIYIKPKHSA